MKRIFCVKCGSEIKEGTYFCLECGERIESRIEPSLKSFEGDVLKEDGGESDDNIGECVNVSSPEAGWSGENQNEKKGFTGKKINWNSRIANMAIVIGIVSLLVGTACRPKNENEINQEEKVVNVGDNVESDAEDESVEVDVSIDNDTVDIEKAIVKTTETYYFGISISEVEDSDYKKYGNLMTKYEYNENGNVVLCEKNASIKNGITETEWEYSEDKLPIKSYSKVYDEEGNVSFESATYEYVYDEEGNPSEYNWYGYNSDGTLVEFAYYVWNASDEEYKITKHIYGKNIEDEHQYNKYGDKILYTHKMPEEDMEITKYEYEYDENGNITKREIIYNDERQNHIYEYNKDGRLEKIYELDEETEKYFVTFKYEYNKYGNKIAEYYYTREGYLFSGNFWTYYE